MAQDQKRSDDAVRITTAAPSADADIRMRQRRYLFSMSLRTLCFVGAVIVGPGLLCWILIAGAIVLPYIAVVMANAASTKTDGFALQDSAYGRPELASGAAPGAAPREI